MSAPSCSPAEVADQDVFAEAATALFADWETPALRRSTLVVVGAIATLRAPSAAELVAATHFSPPSVSRAVRALGLLGVVTRAPEHHQSMGGAWGDNPTVCRYRLTPDFQA